MTRTIRQYVAYYPLHQSNITSHGTGFPSLARVPAQKNFNFGPIHVTLCVCSFPMTFYSETFTCVTHSKSVTLQGPGVPCHNIQNQVDDGPLCRCMMPARRVICDNFIHFKFDIFMCIFFNHYTHQGWFLIVGHPATTIDG